MIEDPFAAHRSLLFTVAYEMLGSAADAEDVVQESWLRWADVDQSQVREPRSLSRQVREYPYGALWFVARDVNRVYDKELFQVVRGTRRLIGFLPTGLGPPAGDETDGPGPAQRSGRLWVPGS